MGEEADRLIDNFFDFDCHTEPYEHGCTPDITCNHCGECNLHWGDTGQGWRLFDDEQKMHSCYHLPRTDMFDDIPF